ncbi:MAG TPA: hypothetical protein VF725_16360 [Ktedonobacterales bacterium]|jgi:hypothetical protein
MAKPTIAIFWVAGLVFQVIGAILFLQVPPDDRLASLTPQSQLMIPLLAIIVGVVANIIAWIGALVLAARLGAWIWFIGLLVFSDIGLLVFLIFGPDFVYTDEYQDAYDEIRNEQQGLSNPNARY